MKISFPYKNVTGMVEVAPIMPLLRIIKKNVSQVKNGIYLSSDVITEHKDFEHYQRLYKQQGIKLSSKFVKKMEQWVDAYKASQSYDFIIIGNYAGINDGDSELAISTANKDDIILIAGKGHETYQIVGKQRFHFSDREIAMECLKKRR